MLLLAEGLFRLDITCSGDTLQSTVRNLSAGELRLRRDARQDAGISAGFGEVTAYEPSRAQICFELGDGEDRVDVDGVIATLRFADRGTIRVTAQAIVRGARPDRAAVIRD